MTRAVLGLGPVEGRRLGGPASSLCPLDSCSARGLEKARLQLQEEVRQVSSQLLEERKKRETHEALARRLQKRVLLLTKVRGAGGQRRPALPAGGPPSGQQLPARPCHVCSVSSFQAPHVC